MFCILNLWSVANCFLNSACHSSTDISSGFLAYGTLFLLSESTVDLRGRLTGALTDFYEATIYITKAKNVLSLFIWLIKSLIFKR